MFDVYSHKNTVCGQLLEHVGSALIYANTHVRNGETGQSIQLPAGHSYEVVADDLEENLSIKFETSHGANDGIAEEVLLKVLIHRGEAQLQENHSEAKSLSVRSLKMALDALVSARTAGL